MSTIAQQSITFPHLPEGRRHAGVAFENGKPSYLLVLHDIETTAKHGDAKAYAAEHGGKIPNKLEGRLLQAVLPEFCAKGSMWLEEDYEFDEDDDVDEEDRSAYAWYQNSFYGLQYFNRKSAALRAVVVSRLPI